MKKQVSTGIVLMGLSTGQLMADGNKFGIGAAIDDNIKLYIPIDAGTVKIEPSLVIISNESSQYDETYEQHYDYDVLEIGVGVFNKKKLTEDADIYYGFRFGYIEVESTSSSVDSEFLFEASQSRKEDGYFMIPTVGVEYYISSGFSLGLDLGLRYEDLDGDITSTSTFSDSTASTEETTVNTQIDVVVRYTF